MTQTQYVADLDVTNMYMYVQEPFPPELIESLRLQRKLMRKVYRHASHRVKVYIRRCLRDECSAKFILKEVKELREDIRAGRI